MNEKETNSHARWIYHATLGAFFIVLYVALTHMPAVGKAFRTIGYFVYPVFMALVIAYVLSPLVRFFQIRVFAKVKSPTANRNLSVGVVCAIIILGCVLILVVLVPQLVTSVMNLIQNLPEYTASLKGAMTDLQEWAARFQIDISEMVVSAGDLLENLTGMVSANAERIISTSFHVGRSVAAFVIAFILAIYFLCDNFPFQSNSFRLLRTLVSPNVFSRTMQFLSQCNDIMMRYISSELLDALIIGGANAVFMLVMKMPYIALISLTVGLTNLAPTFGPIVGGAAGAVILVLVNPWDALGFLIFTVVIQTIDGYFIKPKLFGDMLGISSVWILASIIVGGRVLGVLGVLVAIPLAAIIALLYRDYLLPFMENYREKVNKSKEKCEKSSESDGQAEGKI